MSPKKGYILSIDQGTTSTRAFIFDDKGAVLSSSVREFRQFYPKPGWVEHDASQIWESVRHVIRDCVNKRGLDSKLIKAIGITNQRETTVLWYRKTSKPIKPKINKMATIITVRNNNVGRLYHGACSFKSFLRINICNVFK